MIKRLLIFFILLLFYTYGLLAQKLNEEEIETQFSKAVELFSDNNFSESLLIFTKIADELEFNSKTTASIIFKAKILLQEGKYSDSKKIITSFIERYPGSIYVDEARMMLVKMSFDEANYFASVKETGFLLDHSTSSEYISDAKKAGNWMAFNYLSSIQLQRLSDSFSGNISKPYFLLLLGNSYLKSNDVSNALITFEELISRFPDSEEYSEAEELHSSPVLYSESSVSTNIIGIMLPLQTDETGNYTSATAIEILEGIKYAVSEFNSTRTDKIGLVIRDTKADAEIISEIRDEFSDEPALKVILGPLFSDEVRVTLDEFDGSGIPIISPTATDDDLTGINENFFQANPTFSQRGKIIAQYVYHIENKRKISILNSIDGYSPLLAASFEEEFKRLGGEILTRQSYKSKSFDLVSPVSRIAADSLILEGIYIPLSDNLDAAGILSELVKSNLKTSIYGNQDWFTAKGFETSTQLSNNLTFTSDYFIDFNSNEYIDFNDSFSSITKKDANRNVLYGYDTVKYLLTVMRNIVPSRSSLRSKMVSDVTSIGLRNNICFDGNRINKYLNIVKYQDGVFKLAEKFKLGN